MRPLPRHPKTSSVRCRILALFAAAGPEAGVLSLDGNMIDKPHLRQAERVARRAGLDPAALPAPEPD
jgi:citrate lyase subunit beta/citryl-CoA lyase